MKTINLELSKRLNELWLLDDIRFVPEFAYYTKVRIANTTMHKIEIWIFDNIPHRKYEYDNKIITLTLEEAIEFLPKEIKWEFEFAIKYDWEDKYIVEYNRYQQDWSIIENICETWKTLLEAIEKMLEYLIENNLLIKK